MAKKKQKRTPKESKDADSYPSLELSLKEETRHAIVAIIAFVVALFFILSALEKAGVAGEVTYSSFSFLFGVGYYLAPVLLVLYGVSLIRARRPDIALSHSLAAGLFLVSCLGLIAIALGEDNGGFIGRIISRPFVNLFDVYASILFLGAFLIISIFMLFDARPSFAGLGARLRALFGRKERSLEEDDEDEEEEPEEEEPEEEETEEEEEPAKEKRGIFAKKAPKPEEEEMEIKKHKSLPSTYVPPPLTLLESDKGKANVGDVKANLNIIKRTLQNFGILVEMDEVTIGPSVTRYALKPAEGVKLSKIVGLQNDLALALAAHPIRIEAPIPGKSLVGIEIPNKTKSTVGLATLLSEDTFRDQSKPLMMALGRGISGKAHFGNLAKMPHLLIAGTTGSGKSVTIHSIITSLLYRNGPEAMRFIMVDPKRVELTLYNKIPHLLTPVITEPKKAILALKWAAKEMDRRYDLLEKESVRDIGSYHANVLKAKLKEKRGEDDPEPERMPYIVIIIDELADIMTTYPRELEAGIVRLAQMSRAVGIHLILSTQRPEVSVITGLIKANVPARIALRVSSQIDSRTILDAGGAEKLLGQGDMLYSGGEGQPERVQSAFISEEELKNVVKYLADTYRDEVISELNLTGSIGAEKSMFESDIDNDGGEEDDLYEDARETVIRAGKASTSFLQRKLRVGYARAARLMDILEERGVIGPGDGAKPRDVLEKNLPSAVSDEPFIPSSPETDESEEGEEEESEERTL